MSVVTNDQQAELNGGCTPDGGCVVVDQSRARMGHPAMIVPGAMEGLQAVGAAVYASGVPDRTIDLINVRVSQINGCGVCLLGDLRTAKKKGETDERLATLAGWRETPFFTDAERAALALAEAMTRLNDRSDPVPDEIWDEATRHYDEPALAALVLAIANINFWNRVNVATRQIAGAYEW
jgi:AhpD family alkylhydroperoxidase